MEMTIKCVRMNDKTIVRVSNEQAEKLVKNQEGAYAPKSEFKDQQKNKKG